MKKYECPNNTGVTYNVDTLSKELESNAEFATFFSGKVKEAIMGVAGAAACVDTYYIPTDKEMEDLGIPESKWPMMRKCTESGLLLIIKAKRKFFP